MIEISAAQPLLMLDPDLGQLLSEQRRQTAYQRLTARVATLVPGSWHPDALLRAGDAASVGLLVLDGPIVRELVVHDAPSAELLGPGDVVRTWRAEGPPELLARSVHWRAYGRARVALLGRDSALVLRSYPEVMTIVLDRLNARAERLALTQAISQITGVETRVEALLWHLAERWGRVGRDGVIVGLQLSHRMIGSLIGARRPTVSTAISRLAAQGRIHRRPDGSWLLTGERPADRALADVLAA